MPRVEQERIAAALMKMRENDDGVPGTSQYFRLSCIHGGLPPLSEESHPEYCAHRRECFPGWHRPYLLEFERVMRRADIALGGDGVIGLPYWDWIHAEVNGEVLPGIVRDVLMAEFETDFFPVTPDPGRHGFRMSATRSDANIKRRLERSSVATDALRSLRSKAFAAHATTKFATHRSTSLESPHNSIHGIVSGIMASYQSSFHPVFWMHHNNVERIYTAYLEQNPDSHDEFRTHQARRQPDGARGFPDGPYGPYLPFTNHLTGEPFHARDAFKPSSELGFVFDDLPPEPRPRMHEPPCLALFEDINLLELGSPAEVHVFVTTEGEALEVPAGGWDESSIIEHPSLAGVFGLFFLDTPVACEQCKVNKLITEKVDVTPALRRLAIHPKRATLHVMLMLSDGTIKPPDATNKLPAPKCCGPRFASFSEGIEIGAQADAGDVKELQKLLGATPDGVAGPQTDESIKTFQRRAGLTVDGVAGPITKAAAIVAQGMISDYEAGEAAPYHGRSLITYRFDEGSLEGKLRLQAEAIGDDIDAAFEIWAAATDVNFRQAAAAGAAPDITLRFTDRTAQNKFKFDGPGGALAHASAAVIEFDAAENWASAGEAVEQSGEFWEDTTFRVLPVALHEIGHALGLGHSESERDVMAPYYREGAVQLSENDTALARAKLGVDAA